MSLEPTLFDDDAEDISSSEDTIDKAGLAKFKEVVDRVGATWPDNALKILSERNPALLAMMNSLESRIDSLLLIVHKPKELKAEFSKLLIEYERVIGLCAEYVRRHT